MCKRCLHNWPGRILVARHSLRRGLLAVPQKPELDGPSSRRGGLPLAFLDNGNSWALAAFPLVLGASRLDLSLPQLRWVFYAYDPLSLVALLLIRIPMGNAGYLFFCKERPTAAI
ncbi:hypothetical protein D9M71_703460 [compost metagenome]